MLQPVAATCNDSDVPARYRPVNDVVTGNGRRISGTGAATIGDYVVLVGNLIADLDYEVTARVLRVPDEKYRDKTFKSVQENLTTLKRETGRVPDDVLARFYVTHDTETPGVAVHDWVKALPKTV